MSKDKVILLRDLGTPGPAADALTELLRDGARWMLAAAIRTKVEEFPTCFKDEKMVDGGSASRISSMSSQTEEIFSGGTHGPATPELER